MLLILEEHDLESYAKGEVAELEGDEDTTKHKNLVKAKRIIVESIKDHLISHVFYLKTPKEMFDALTKLFEGKNINQKMTLRTQLKNVKMKISKTIQYHFTRVSHIKNQLIGDQVEEARLEKMGEDDEPIKKRPRKDDTSEGEYVLRSTFTESVAHGSDT